MAASAVTVREMAQTIDRADFNLYNPVFDRIEKRKVLQTSVDVETVSKSV